MTSARIYDELRKLLGPGLVTSDAQNLISYSSDMLPQNQILKLSGKLPTTQPLAVCFPESLADVRRVMEFAYAERLPVTPYAGGSGVCGSAIPVEGGIVMDLKRLDKVLDLDGDNLTVTLEPGILGERLEEHLNYYGYTLGHFPSSIACSTAGGYVACRSAGQYSSRYGKIEDLTLGLEVVLANGEVTKFGILGDGHPGEPMMAVQLGAEGTLGVVTRICFRIEPLPETIDFRGFAFPEVEDGVQFMRNVMQHPLRPTVLRLYDPLDSLIAGFHSKTSGGEDIHKAVARLGGVKHTIAQVLTELNDKGLSALLYRPAMVNRIAEILPTKPLLIIGVQGDKATVSRQWDSIGKIAGRQRGEDLGPEPGHSWFKRRYAVSYKQAKIFSAGAFVDTMEVASTWDNLLPIYKAVLKSMGKHVFIMAHFSHAYEEGCSIYFTFAGYRPTARGADNAYKRAWKEGLGAVMRYGGTISHHHSVGTLKRWAMSKENPGGEELFAAFKAVLDERNTMNPGKLYNLGLP